MASTISETVLPPPRWGVALLDLGGLLALVWAIPFAVLIVGVPIAAAITLLLWLGRLVLGGF